MHRFCWLSVFLLSAAAMAQGASTTVVASWLPSSPTARLAFDGARQRLVSSEPGQPVSEFDGAVWAPRNVALPAGVMLYDPTIERIVVVGSAGVIAYDGAGTTVIGPAFSATAVVADSARGRLVALVGAPSVPAMQVWEFGGSSWAQVAQIPGNYFLRGAAFDPQRATTVTAMVQMVPTVQGQVWEWNGTNLVGPLLLGQSTDVVGFDPGAQELLIGRLGFSGAGIYVWNGVALTQRNSNYPDVYGSICGDPGNGRLLRSWNYDIWQWTGSSWLALAIPPMPFTNSALLTHDEGRSRTVLLGTSAGPLHTEWDGVAWRLLPTTSGGPQALYRHAQAFDAARGETVVFGGSLGSGSPVVGTTYGWNGATWRLAATSGPAPRYAAAMTYDAARQRVVLIGGRDPATQTTFVDHWEWDGLSWTQVPTPLPFGGWPAILGFDPVRQRVVAHDLQRRTFEYDGATWTAVAPFGPLLAYGTDPADPFHTLATQPSFAWHASSQRLVVNAQVGSSLATFGWNGVDWQAVALPTGLHAEAANGSLLAVSNQTQLVSNQAATTAAYGAGCGGSTTATSLSAFGRPVLGSANFHLDLRAEATQALAVFGFGDTTANLSLGNGCTLWVGGLFALEARLTDAHGFSRLLLVVPPTPALAGTALTVQGLVFDAASPGGLALTQGRSLQLGD